MEAFCSYILRNGWKWAWTPKNSTKSASLQNLSKSLSATSLQTDSPQPHLFGRISPRAHSTKWRCSSTHQSPAPFSLMGFETKKRKQESFCRHESLQPHLRYASGNGVGATSTTKWQTWGGKQTSLSHLDPINPSKQFLSMLHPYLPLFTILYLSLSISIYLCVTSGYVWWILVGWGWHLGAKWLGCVWSWPGTTKWRPYKFLGQSPLQNGNLGLFSI